MKIYNNQYIITYIYIYIHYICIHPNVTYLHAAVSGSQKQDMFFDFSQIWVQTPKKTYKMFTLSMPTSINISWKKTWKITSRVFEHICMHILVMFFRGSRYCHQLPSSSSGEHLLLPSLSTSFTNSCRSTNLQVDFAKAAGIRDVLFMLCEVCMFFDDLFWAFTKESFFARIFTSKFYLWQNA